MTPSKRPPSGSEYPWAAFSETVCDPRAYTAWGPVPPPPSGWSWEGLMLQAIAKARQAPHQGEVPVGALIVDPAGTILAAEHNQPITLSDPSAHAEIMAMRSAGTVLGNYRLEGCILVVTLEPCLMCTGAIVHARLAGVVYGAADNKAGAVESCFNGLDLPFHNHRVWHMGGIAAPECASLLQKFFQKSR